MPLIYKLYDDEDCYVGSTTETLKERLSKHICIKSCYSRIIVDRNKFTMELIEEVETNDRYDRENYWITELSTLSQYKAPLPIEKRKENKIQLDREYRLKHLEKDKARGVSDILCECGVYYSPKHKTRHNKTQRHLKRTDPIYIEKEKQFQEDKKKRQAEYKAQWYKKKTLAYIDEER